MRVDAISEGVYRIWLSWSNAYVLTEDVRATVLDTGVSGDRDDLLRALNEIGVDRAAITEVLLTHGHCDHVGNAAMLAESVPASPGCPPIRPNVYISAIEAPYVTGEIPTYAARGMRVLWRPVMSWVMYHFEARFPAANFQPDTLLNDGDVLDVPGGPLRVVASPGHSPGHVSFFRERDRLLFSGDAIMNINHRGKVGLTVPLAIFSEDIRVARDSARRLTELDPTALLSGHGPLITEDTAAKLRAWTKTLP